MLTRYRFLRLAVEGAEYGAAEAGGKSRTHSRHIGQRCRRCRWIPGQRQEYLRLERTAAPRSFALDQSRAKPLQPSRNVSMFWGESGFGAAAIAPAAASQPLTEVTHQPRPPAAGLTSIFSDGLNPSLCLAAPV